MANCPKCKAEIDHLVHFWQHWSEDRFTVIGDRAHYQADDFIFSDPIQEDFVCPACDEVLYHTETEAIAIMKGEVNETITA